MTAPQPVNIHPFRSRRLRKIARRSDSQPRSSNHSTETLIPDSGNRATSLDLPTEHLEYAPPPLKRAIPIRQASGNAYSNSDVTAATPVSSVKRKLWLPVVVFFAFASSSALGTANAQGQQLLYEVDCVQQCVGAYTTKAALSCPSAEDENTAYDCAILTCNAAYQEANMYVTGYLMQKAKADWQTCGSSSSGSSGTANSSSTTSVSGTSTTASSTSSGSSASSASGNSTSVASTAHTNTTTGTTKATATVATATSKTTATTDTDGEASGGILRATSVLSATSMGVAGLVIVASLFISIA